MEELEQEAVMKSVSLLWGGLTWMSLRGDADARTHGRTDGLVPVRLQQTGVTVVSDQADGSAGGGPDPVIW